MKLLFFILMALVALLAIVAQHSSRKVSYRSQLRAGVRPFTFLERISIPFVRVMTNLNMRWNRMLGSDRIALANEIAVSDGPVATRLADAALSRRSFVKVGSDGYHVAACTSADIPIGHTGEASTSAAEERISYGVLGLHNRSIEAITSGTVNDGDFLVVAAATTVKTLPVITGTYYVIGRYSGPTILTGKPISFIPCFPDQRLVA